MADDSMRYESTESVQRQQLSDAFKLIFTSVLAIAFSCFIAFLALAVFADESEAVKRASDTCADVFKLCVGTIVGLIAGKAV